VLFNRLFFLLIAVVISMGPVANGQISSAFPSTSCLNDVVDAPAACTIEAFCTPPSDPIDGFVIGANAFKTCPNQPVENIAQANAAIGGTQASSQAKATALIFQRLIKQQIRVADCKGNTAILIDTDDPQGCNPPPPPPPPQCDPDAPPELRFGNPDGVPNPCASPIIIDLTGNGFQLTSAANGIKFDIANSGTSIQIAWTANSNNAWLVLDRNGNGVINSGAEMFGNFTAQPSSPHPNGFAALAVYDDPANGGNGDGVIDARDTIFSSLRLWVDANHDGISQPRELHTLPELGIFSISLDYALSERKDQYGNIFRYRARVNQGMNGPADVGKTAFDVFLVAQ
jgi:hypothetical protein